VKDFCKSVGIQQSDQQANCGIFLSLTAANGPGFVAPLCGISLEFWHTKLFFRFQLNGSMLVCAALQSHTSNDNKEL